MTDKQAYQLIGQRAEELAANITHGAGRTRARRSARQVEVCDWYDGKSIYFCVKYYRPGANMTRPPALERSALISREDYQAVMYYTDSLARAIMGDSTELMGKSALPLLSEYRGGLQTVRDGVAAAEATA